MRVVSSIAELRRALAAGRDVGSSVGLVPTMGYLHEGHRSLMVAARRETGLVVATIFVNPLQFAAGEDLSTYPRDLDGDTSSAESAGVDLLFVPEVTEMYPGEVRTSVQVSGISEGMEGGSRPTHFAGVATVVAKLFAIVGECRAYFGEKDFQQLVVIRQMVRDLSFPVQVVGCPIVREPDGLAMSSRNVYLSAIERAAAPVLHRALLHGAAVVRGGERDPRAVEAAMVAVVGSEPTCRLDYFEVADPDTLEPVQVADEGSRIFGAVQFSRARLIDNVAVSEAAR